MKYTLTFAESDYEELIGHLFIDTTVERAAYAMCKLSSTDNETRLLVREIIPVQQDDIEEQSATSMKIANRSFLRAMKHADQTKQVFLFIHSHPKEYKTHSKQDDIEEAKLFKTAYIRIKRPGVHGSLVLSGPDKPICRIWLEDGTIKPVELIRVLGDKFRFYSDFTKIDSLPIFFDRQIRAFGDEIQKTLQMLHVGIVGVGGTGSAITEQLIRLGVGKITIIDGETFEKTNVNRVYGSSVNHNEKNKTQIALEQAEHIGLGTQIITDNKPIFYRSSAEKLKTCDIVFGCTDDNWGRSILTKLAVYYLIPVFDMGVKIDSKDGTIKSIQGRVTTLLPGHACLFCRGRVTAKKIQSESLAILDPARLEELKKEGYADELETTAPAVIPFTTTIASLAVSELLHRLTGYMGEDRKSNEILMLFDQTTIRRNKTMSKPECFCGDPYNILRGDVNPFLDLTWRNEI